VTESVRVCGKSTEIHIATLQRLLLKMDLKASSADTSLEELGPVGSVLRWEHLHEEALEDGHGDNYHLVHDFEFVEKVVRSPLCRRVWVIQKRFLAPRNLHFGSNQLWWECRELCASEKYPHGLPSLTEGSIKQQWDPLNVLQKRDAQIGIRPGNHM
jgi:hypothetical protein